MSPKNKHRNTNDYLKYLKGELSGQERHAFERGLEADPFEKEAMEGLESISHAQAEEDLLLLHNKLRKRLARRRRIAWYSVAATVASLLIVGTIFLKVRDFDPRSPEKQAYPEDLFEAPVTQETESQQPEEEAMKETPTESRPAEKGPAEDPLEDPVEDPVEDPLEGLPEDPSAEKKEAVEIFEQEADPDIEISRMAAPRPQAIEEAQVVEEPEAVEEPVEQVTYMEAAPAKRKKSTAQPVAAPQAQVPETEFDAVRVERMLTGKVTGVVVSSEDLEPIPGAIVLNRESSSGVYTDGEGRFGIPVREDTPSTLVTSFIGMETQEYQVEDGADVELIMQTDAAALNEVLMLDYVAELENMPTGSAIELYQADEEKDVEYDVPEPSIGFKNYRQYIEENIRFPQELGNKKEVVVLKFTLTSKGEITEVLALRSPGVAFTEEATRLLMEGPGWNPASTEQGTRDQSVRIRIVFRK